MIYFEEKEDEYGGEIDDLSVPMKMENEFFEFLDDY